MSWNEEDDLDLLLAAVDLAVALFIFNWRGQWKKLLARVN